MLLVGMCGCLGVWEGYLPRQTPTHPSIHTPLLNFYLASVLQSILARCYNLVPGFDAGERLDEPWIRVTHLDNPFFGLPATISKEDPGTIIHWVEQNGVLRYEGGIPVRVDENAPTRK